MILNVYFGIQYDIIFSMELLFEYKTKKFWLLMIACILFLYMSFESFINQVRSSDSLAVFDYFLPLISMLFLCGLFLFPKKQEIFIDNKNKIFLIKKYILFNISFYSVINFYDIKKFETNVQQGIAFIYAVMVCGNKSTKKQIFVTPFDYETVGKLCISLNKLLLS